MGVYLYDPIVVHTSRGHRGGGRQWSKWARDIQRFLKHDRSANVRLTTMFDLYGLPKDFPRFSEHSVIQDTNRRCDLLQEAMAEAIDDRRLIQGGRVLRLKIWI